MTAETELRGLTREEVLHRVRLHQTNENVAANTRSVKQIVKENLLTYFNLIFAILAVLLLITGSFRDMTFLSIIIANALIGIIQEVHAKKVLDKLTLLNAPKVSVLRDGKQQEIISEKLVLDDVILLDSGKQVPADCTVLSGKVQANESLLTGESDEIEKNVGAALFSGSYIVSGKCYAKVDKVGKNSYISKLMREATKEKTGEQSEMVRAMDRLLVILGILIIPIGIALFVQSYFYNEETFQSSISSMVAALIGMIPEGLYLLTSVSLAVSAARLAGKQVLVHNMKCIETLARVDVLCVDKTGTITEPIMVVRDLVPVTAVGAEEKEKPVSTDALRAKVSDFTASMTKDNDTMKALQKAFRTPTGKRADTIVSFSSKYKYSGAAFGDETYVLGAPEFVLRSDYEKYREQIEEQAKQGYRVVVFAKYAGSLDGKALTKPAVPEALILLENPVREGAERTFQYFASQGVKTIVISGDNPLTVSETAKRAGIANADKYVDARRLRNKRDIYEAAQKYTVFGRVVPEQKKLLVKALKAQGKTVAMTGDGVNDILALREADCSVAMASGSDAASQIAQLVLLDSDFTRMPAVVAEGRRVVNNIQRSAALYLVKNIFSVLLALFSVILMLGYPLEPSQVSLISLFTIGIPSFVLALEPNHERIRGHFMTNVLLKALPAGLTDFLVVSGLVIFCREFNVDTESLSTSVTILVAIVGFMIVYTIAKPMQRHHWIMLFALIAGWLYCMLFISHFFAITSINTQCAMLMVLFALATEPLMRYFTKLFSWILEKLQESAERNKSAGKVRRKRT